MEGFPEIRIIGTASEDAKQEIRQEILDELSEKHLLSLSEDEIKRIKEAEFPKTENEAKSFQLADTETRRLMEEAGVQPWSLPLDNLHFVPNDLYNELGGLESDHSGAYADSYLQAIFARGDNYEGNIYGIALTSFHELFHLKGHVAYEINQVNETTHAIHTKSYRGGVHVNSLQRFKKGENDYGHFVGLNEAITAQDEKDFAERIINDEIFKAEREWRASDTFLQLRKELAQELGIPEGEFTTIDCLEAPDDKVEITSKQFGYPKQREVYLYVLNEILLQYPKKFPSIEDVKKLFLNAHFTGNLMDIMRLVEGTFGKGSFRVLGEMDERRESEKAAEVLNNLKQRRIADHPSVLSPSS